MIRAFAAAVLVLLVTLSGVTRAAAAPAFARAEQTYPLCRPQILAYRAAEQAVRDSRGFSGAPSAEDRAAIHRANASLAARRREVDACISATVQARRGFEFSTDGVLSVSATASGALIATADSAGQVMLWNRETGRARRVPHELSGLREVALDRQGQRLALAARTRTWVVDTVTLQLLSQHDLGTSVALSEDALLGLNPQGTMISRVVPDAAEQFAIERTLQTVAFDPAGARAWTGLELVDLGSGKRTVPRDLPQRPLHGAFDGDGNRLYVAERDGAVAVVDPGSGQVLDRIALAIGPAGYPLLAVSGNGRHLGLADSRGNVWLADLGARRIVASGAHAAPVADLTFAGPVLLSAGADGAVSLWSAGSEQDLGRLVSFKSGAWAVLEPGGRFDAPDGGAQSELVWRARERRLSASQLTDRFWQPMLLRDLLSGEPLSAAPDADLSPAPDVVLVAPVGRTVGMEIRDQGGGIGAVQVRLNGKEIDAAVQSAAGRQQILLPADAIRTGRDNRLEVIASNRANDLAARGVSVEWIDTDPAAATAAADPATPNLYAIVVGISDYRGEAIDLKFAAEDARRFGQALDMSARRLFGPEHVHVTVLTGASASRDGIARAFEQARSATVDDLLVVYFSGHGVAGPDTYRFATAEADALDALSPSSAVSSDELVAWIKRIPARKQAMVLDTCGAGAVQRSLLEPRGPSAAEVRAINRLKARTGFHVLMGSAADSQSFEANRYGQGLLTYALLDGLRGDALRLGRFVDVSRWFQHALDQVPELARHLGGIQQPLLAAPRGDSFDLGELTEADRARIPLADPRPLLLRPVLVDAAAGYDALQLSDNVMSELRARVDVAMAPAVLVDADRLPGAIQVSGLYGSTAAPLTADVKLVRDGAVLTSVSARGAGVSELAETLAERIIAAAGDWP